MNYYDIFTSEILSRRNGEKSGIPTNLNFSEFSQIERDTYYLVGGETGTGKTSFVDHVFLMNALEEYIVDGEDKNFFCLYFSMEVSRKRKLLKLAVNKLYRDKVLTQKKRPIDINMLLSKNKPLTDSGIEHVKGLETFFKVLQDKVNIYEIPKTASETLEQIENFVNKHLELHTEEFLNEITNKKVTKETWVHKSNKKPAFLLIIYDHIALLQKSRGSTFAKDQMDELSAGFVAKRNKYELCICGIQQLKAKNSFLVQKEHELYPTLDDFSDSKNMQKDANVVLTIFSPARYELKEYKDYNITTLRDRYRSVYKLKDRDGQGLGDRSLLYVGESGAFLPMPPATELNGATPENRKLLEDVLTGINILPQKERNAGNDVNNKVELDFNDNDPY